jgi:hypothetical protein
MVDTHRSIGDETESGDSPTGTSETSSTTESLQQSGTGEQCPEDTGENTPSTSGMDEPTPRPMQLDKLVKGVEAYSDAADLSRNMTQMNYPRQNKVVGIVDFVRTFCYDVAKDIATKLSPSDRARVIRWSNEQVSRLATLPPGAAMPNDILVASMILRQILPGAKDVDL